MLDMLLIDNPVVTNCLIDQVCQSFISSPVYDVVVFTVSKTLCLLCHEKYMHKAFAMSNCFFHRSFNVYPVQSDNANRNIFANACNNFMLGTQQC